MANLLNIYPEDLFADPTFKVCREAFYQLLILRIFDPSHNTYPTVAFILMKNKTKFLYMKALVFIKCNIKKLFKNELIINRFHCHFEEGLSSALCECFPNAKLKYCFFHYGQIIFRKIRSTGNNGLNINNKFEVSKKAENYF